MAEIDPVRRRGRPPKPDAEKTRGNITFRSRPGTRERLEESAIVRNRSISEEVEARISRSFDYDDIHAAIDDGFRRSMRELFGGPELSSLMQMLASDFSRARRDINRVYPGDDWFDHPTKEQEFVEAFLRRVRQTLADAAEEQREAKRQGANAVKPAAGQ